MQPIKGAICAIWTGLATLDIVLTVDGGLRRSVSTTFVVEPFLIFSFAAADADIRLFPPPFAPLLVSSIRSPE